MTEETAPKLCYHEAKATDPDEDGDRVTLQIDGVTVYVDEIREVNPGYNIIKSGEVVGYIPEDKVGASPVVVLREVRENKKDIPLR
jgi:hypothetical protein